jgi:hypothetical protein
MNWSTKNMETDLLVSLLARGVTPVDRHVVARRLGWALLAAALGATLLVVSFYGIRPDIGTVSATPIFWAKVALPVALAAGALAVTIRLARPGARVGLAWAGIGIPIAAVWLAGLIAVLLAPEGAPRSRPSAGLHRLTCASPARPRGCWPAPRPPSPTACIARR